MIQLTKLSGETVYVNPNYIITLEATPDSIIFLISNDKIIVKESISQILFKIQQQGEQQWTEPALSASL